MNYTTWKHYTHESDDIYECEEVNGYTVTLVISLYEDIYEAYVEHHYEVVVTVTDLDDSYVTDFVEYAYNTKSVKAKATQLTNQAVEWCNRH